MSSRSPRSLRFIGTLRVARELSWSDWAVLAGAGVVLPVVTVALKLIGLQHLLRVVEALGSVRGRAHGSADAERIVRLVDAAAGRCLPRPTCLARALVALALLRRRGLPADLVIGVMKRRGRLQGHAWVRLGDVAVGPPAPPGHTALVLVAGRGDSASRLAPAEPA